MSAEETDPKRRPSLARAGMVTAVPTSSRATVSDDSRSFASRRSRERRMASAWLSMPAVATIAFPAGSRWFRANPPGDVDDVAALADPVDVAAEENLHPSAPSSVAALSPTASSPAGAASRFARAARPRRAPPRRRPRARSTWASSTSVSPPRAPAPPLGPPPGEDGASSRPRRPPNAARPRRPPGRSVVVRCV